MKHLTPTELKTRVANLLADKTADAYSADRYRSWRGVAVALLSAGYDVQQAEAIMRSKWARWAADKDGRKYGTIPARVLVEYAQGMSVGDVYDLTRETFGTTAEEEKRPWSHNRKDTDAAEHHEAHRERLVAKLAAKRGGR